MYAHVAFPKVASFYDKLFVYKVPQDLIQQANIGMQVLAPFGKRLYVGYIMKLSEFLDEEIDNIKEIEQIRGKHPFFFDFQAKVALWLSKYYISFIGSALKTILMPNHEKFEKLKNSSIFVPIYTKLTPPKNIPKYSLDDLNKDLCKIFDDSKEKKYLILNQDSKFIEKELIKIASILLSESRSLLLLYPDIDYLEPMYKTLKSVFGDFVSLIHSSLPKKQNFEEWQKIYCGQKKIILGTRSAIFSPIKDLGLIIVENEDMYGYKQETNPKYNIKDVATYISEIRSIPVVFTSILPTVETYYKTLTKQLTLIKIPTTSKRVLPEILDMKKEKKIDSGIFSFRLFDRINSVISKGGKILLITARKAHSTTLCCQNCGEIIVCPKCQNSLVYTQKEQKIVCMKCKNVLPLQIACPNCFSNKISFSGFGTQKVDFELKRLVPLVRTVVIDRYTVTEGQISKIIEKSLVNGKINTVIGTILVEKAIQILKFDLIAIVSLDTYLQSGDTRAPEEIFRLIVKFSQSGADEFFVQTYNFSHYVFSCAKNLDTERFYIEELKMREETFSPPFSQLIRINVFSKENDILNTIITKVYNDLKKFGELKLLGPVFSNKKEKSFYKSSILIKGKDLAIIKSEISKFYLAAKKDKIKITVDVDPIE